MKKLLIAVTGLSWVFATSAGAALVLHLKADDLALPDGTAVTNWTSGVAPFYVAGQATGSKQPTYEAGELNGHAVVRFDGTDDTLLVPSITLDSDMTVFLVGKVNGAGVPLILEQSANASGNDGFYIHGGQGYSATMHRSGPNGYNFGSGYWTGSDYTLFEFVFDPGTDAWSASTNGVPLSASLQNFTDIPSGSFATDALNIMSRNQTSFYTAGDIAELRIYSGSMTVGERASIASALNATYFIPEPSSLALLACGGLLVLARRRA